MKGRGATTPFRTLGELEARAERRVPAAVWGYIAGGAGAERTVRRNVQAFDRWDLCARVLRGVREVDLATSVLGAGVTAPFFVAPTAYHGTIHSGGESATAAAAGRLGLLGVYSTLSSHSLEAIARAAGGGPHWFQLYLQPDPKVTVDLLRRAERAGYGAIVVTVDTPVLGWRDRQGQSGFALGRLPPMGNGPNVNSPARGPVWDGGRARLERDAEVSWRALERVRRETDLPLVVKGILHPADARRAVELGAEAVVVSNHGGRQLDLAPASLDALPSVVRAVGRKAEVYLDGGVRRGADVLVALALGAKAVGLGRPVLWALAAGGRGGVEQYLRLLGGELANAMILLGCASVRDVDRSCVMPMASGPG